MTIRDLPPSVLAFARAVGWGSFAGGAPYLLLTVPLGVTVLFDDAAGMNRFGGLYLMVMPLLISFPVVLIASAFLGLPLTALLARLGWERGQLYVALGLIAGSAPFVIAMFYPDMSDMGLLASTGGLSGAVTGWIWGRYRDQTNNSEP